MAKWQLYKYLPKQRVCIDWADRPRNYKGLYGILQLLQGSHLDIFPQKTLKLHQHNVQIFNLIDIRNSPQCLHVSAVGYVHVLQCHLNTVTVTLCFENVGRNIFKHWITVTKLTNN